VDYLCAKFGNFSFSGFDFIVRTESQAEIESHTEADDRYTHATTVGVSNYQRPPQSVVYKIQGNKLWSRVQTRFWSGEDE